MLILCYVEHMRICLYMNLLRISLYIAKKIRKELGQSGPLTVLHLREAHHQLQQEGQFPFDNKGFKTVRRDQ